MAVIDFQKLPKDGRRFEAMVCELLRSMSHPIIQEPSIGPDGGRDILIERVTKDDFGERRDRVVVQCKHFAHSGRAVSERDLGVWTGALHRSGAIGYLLVTSTTVTENLNRAFSEFSRNESPKFAAFWAAEKLEILLNEHLRVRDTFFPPDVPRLEDNLGQYGWGIVFPADVDPRPIRLALKPLLGLRKKQIKSTGGPAAYREFSGSEGVQADESALEWLARHGVGPGTPNPSRVPRFLLLIGGPDAISFEFQVNLGVQYFVGRLGFDLLSEYSTYAQALVESVCSRAQLFDAATFIAPENKNDDATRASSNELVDELTKDLAKKRPDWTIKHVKGDRASKKGFLENVAGPEGAVLTFAAAHGLAFRPGDNRQRTLQGALVTNDWPGPGTPVLPEHAFAASDLISEARQTGRMFFFFGCYGAGTICGDEYSGVFNRERKPYTSTPFLAALPQRLLAAGALAVIGNVGPAWRHSFTWKEAGPQPQTFLAVLESLLSGEPVGVAVRALSQRYAELAAAVTSIEADPGRAEKISADELISLKIAMLDAKYYLVLGDPCARLELKTPSPYGTKL